MGTNTFHLLLVEVLNNGSWNMLSKKRIPVRLGQGGLSQGIITKEASERAISAISEFRREISLHNISNINATATSALRSARNANELLIEIEKKTGIQVKVISGEQEAEFIYHGVKKALDIGEVPSLIMDIGGGSVEFIIGSQNEILWLESFEIGGQRLMDNFFKHDPITESDIKSLNSHLEASLESLDKACRRFQPKTLIGSSGTFDTFSDIYSAQNSSENDPSLTELPFDFSQFTHITEKILTSTREERLAFPGMIPMRVEMIVVATVLLKYIISLCKIQDIRISAYALKEGILVKYIDSNSN